MMIQYAETSEFQKDLKKLTKRFRSLPDDLKVVKKAVIELYHIQGINSLSAFEIPGYSSEEISFWKIKKFACRALKGRGAKSGIRVIYAFDKTSKEVTFIEMYFKGDKENEDHTRMKNF